LNLYVFFLAGYEGSGIVQECGAEALEKGFNVGDHVYFLGDGAGTSGSFAEFCQVKW
jgi:NADPH:quinone reductase-like Zn-dependent oxidoreductase